MPVRYFVDHINHGVAIWNGILINQLKQGPIAAAVDSHNWHSYASGVYNGPCDRSSFNHAVLMVGLGSTGTFLVKSSWGTSWGEQGYIRLKIDHDCGLLAALVVPNLL